MKLQPSIFILYLLHLFNVVHAQSGINVSGLDISGINGSINSSIGELFYTTKGNTYKLTEGMQNGTIINPVDIKLAIHVSVYPNPSSDYIYFKVENLNFKNLHYSLFNSQGIELLNGEIVSTSTNLSLKTLPASVYFIKIYRNASEMQSFKILKIN